MEPLKRENPIVEKSFQFALQIVAFAEILEAKGKKIVANQVIRSGTSIGANVRESQAGESPRDFLHKMRIAAKEAEETKFWLMICQESPNYPNCSELLTAADEIIRILTAIIHSTKKKIQ